MAGGQKRPSNRTWFPPSYLCWGVACLFTMPCSSFAARAAGTAWLCSLFKATSQNQSRAPPDRLSVSNAN